MSDEENEDNIENEFSYGEKDENVDSMSITNQDVDFEEEEEENLDEAVKYKQMREDAQWPDEVETSANISARERFQKYRGLKSFRFILYLFNSNYYLGRLHGIQKKIYQKIINAFSNFKILNKPKKLFFQILKNHFWKLSKVPKLRNQLNGLYQALMLLCTCLILQRIFLVRIYFYVTFKSF